MNCLVCHLIDANIDTAYFRSIARLCDKGRYPVMIGSITPEGALQEAMQKLGADTYSLNVTSRSKYVLAIKRLVSLIKNKNVGMVHAHCFDPTFVALAAARIARVPFVFTRHHSDHNIRLGKKWHTKIDSWCAKRADHVIAVSEVTKRLMIEVEGVPSNQITVVYNGMEPLREPTKESIARTRSEIGPLAENVCLMIGRLHEEKGHRFLFDALPQVESCVGPVTALLAGDGAQRAEIEQQARERGVTDKVKFLGRRDDVSELIALSSVVVLPSLAESFGFAVLEAMSFNKPVVAATTGGIPEVLGEAGILVPQSDSKALAEAMCKVLLDKEMSQRLGKAGVERAKEFTFERMLRGYEAVYDKVLHH
jgi:glycosyltransferase involved in cell wall biosynthesis